MPRHKHVLIANPGEERGYTSPTRGGGVFATPPRDRRIHARKLRSDVDRARQDAAALAEETGHTIDDLCLEILGEPGYELKLESLEDARLGIQVRSVHKLDDRLHATVYVPAGKLQAFVRKIERYELEDTTPRSPAGTRRPKNEDLVAGIGEIRLAVLKSFWTDEDSLYPSAEDQTIGWEVWVHVGHREDHDAVFAEFVATVADSSLRLSPHAIRFPERLVFLAFGTPAAWTRCFVPLLDRLAELRRAKEVPTDFLHLSPQDQRAFVQDLATRIIPPRPEAPAVCLLDYGIHAAHPLLRPLISDTDAHVIDQSWERVDRSETHGTEMAGLIALGDNLPSLLSSPDRVTVSHRLESVRMLRTEHAHAEDAWGYVTQAGLAIAETTAPRRQRVACLAVTANDRGRDHGSPSSWSAALDEHASGQLDDQRRLYVVSAGNVRDIATNGAYAYPTSNLDAYGIEDPGQSWNALTVGAFTDRVAIRSRDFEGYQPLAPRGGLCPTSRTSCSWDEKAWPFKPDIVMEGGNYARSPAGRIDGCDDLALLTTSLDATGRLLTWSSDTSAATALAARAAAILMADYPELWPETIRGLLVHSSEWTDEMRRQIRGDLQDDRHRRLRCFGYGAPNLERARYTVENCVSLVHQGEIQPFRLYDGQTKTNHFVLHSLPWPRAALQELHDANVTIRITLSYFIEPSPAGRGWGKKFRYASHGLRFALQGPVETPDAFRRRISTQEWEEEGERPGTSDPIGWAIGSRLRTHGSLHCDWWTATAADVAECGQLAVFPVTGWWRERKHLGFVEKRTRYALIITISTEATDVDLYTPIAQQVGVTTEIIA